MITINLDPKYYGKIDLFDQRFSEGVPSLIQCESLTIKGDVRFESNVTIIGNVTIRNEGSDQAVIQRYLTTKDESSAARAVWTNAALVMPVSAIFFALGTALFVYYQNRPSELSPALTTEQSTFCDRSSTA